MYTFCTIVSHDQMSRSIHPLLDFYFEDERLILKLNPPDTEQEEIAKTVFALETVFTLCRKENMFKFIFPFNGFQPKLRSRLETGLKP